MIPIKKGARYIVLLFCLVCLSACTPLQTKQLQEQPLQQRQALIDVPFVPQDPYYCGPATVSMLLQHRGQSAQQDIIAKSIYLPGRKGTLQTELKAYIRQSDLLAYQIAPQLRALLLEIQAGNPVLVLQNLSFNWWPRWHYAVAVGYDLDRNQIILHTGDLKNYRLGLGTFERTWKRSGFWGITVGNPSLPEQLPASLSANANIDELLSALFELEATSQRFDAQNSYYNVAKRWPHSSRAWFSLGNALYEKAQDTPGRLSALKAFLKANQLQTDPGYLNNIAYLAAELGCTELHNNSLQCGLMLDPGNRYLTDTLQNPPQKREIELEIECPTLNPCKKSVINEHP